MNVQLSPQSPLQKSPSLPSLQPYFEALYARHPDPWRVGDRWYEVRKRKLLLAALPRARFSYAYEPGCGNGELTVELAARCDRVLATDFSESAIATARRRLQDVQNAGHVELCRQTVPQDWPWPANALNAAGPDGINAAGNRFDLIVISEFAYYLPDDALQMLATLAAATLSNDGCLIACHWRHDFAERLHTADAAHAAFDHQCGLHRAGGYRDADFLLDIWTARSGSVARREGLL
jgi:SAM-dependent methyltransferase